MATAPAIAEHKHVERQSRTLPRWVPYLLALFFAGTSLYRVRHAEVTDTDAARHAMNGAFLYDLVRTGHLAHPIEYAKEFFGHFPALSMPFHPPGFPAIEAVFFAIFGVSAFAARLAVAVAIAICALLFFRLVQSTMRNDIIAACATVTLLSLWTVQLVSGYIMLEFPSLVFVLAALYCIRHLERGYPLGRALLFGVFTAAAMWTKQHAVFLALVPVFWILLSRRWGMLLRTGMWISSAITVASVAGLVLLSMPFNHAGTNRVSTSVPSFVWNLGWNVRYYREWLGRNVLGLPVVFAVCALAVYLFTRHRRPAREFPLKLYFAWLLSVPVVLLLVSAASGRYLIYLFPAVITLGYLMLWEGCSCLWGERRASYILAGFAAAWFAAGSFAPLDYLRGPAQAAAFVAKDGPTRVLYAGEADGNFIFALRSLDPSLRSVVVPGDKLQPPTFQPAALERFCRTYGIRWVVFENGTTNPHKWDALSDRQAPSMRLERSIPMETSRSRWQGYKIDIYRFDGPVDPPGGVLKLPVWKLGVNLDVKL